MTPRVEILVVNGFDRRNRYGSEGLLLDERIRVQLRDAVFADVDHVVEVLRGNADDDLEIAVSDQRSGPA